MIEFKDREPTYAHRMRITPEDGSAAFYATVERADEPVTEGTPLNAETFHALQQAVGVMVYTHSRSAAGVHNFVGTGPNGRALLTAGFASGDTFRVNGVAVTAWCGANAVDGDTIASGRWVSFTYDEERNTLNFKGGGGLTSTKLSTATAKAAHVLTGKTFYSGNKTLKTGNLPEYPDTYPDHTKTEVIERDYLAYHIPRGAYTVSGGPYIRATKAQVATAIGLTANKIACGNTVLGVVGSVWVPVGIALACAATSGRSGIVITGGTIITNGYGTFSGGNSYDSGSEVAGKDVTSKLVFTVAKAGKYRVSGFQNTNIRFVRPGNDGGNHGTSGTAATSYAAGAVSLEVGSAIEITATADGVDYDSVNCGSLSGRAVLISYVGA